MIPAHTTRSCLALAMMTLAPLAWSGSSAELRVTGRIVPNACQADFATGAMADYGRISSTSLSAGALTVLQRKPVTLAISCTVPTSLAMRIADNRAPSPATGMQPVVARASLLRDARVFSLRDTEGRHVGGYVLDLAPHQGNGAPRLEAAGDGANWSASEQSRLRRDTLYTWAGADGRTPRKVDQVVTTFDVQAMIDHRGAAYGAVDDVPLDGSATFELVYF